MSRLLGLIMSVTGFAAALNDGFGRTPVMGYNTYNDVACSPNDTQVRDAINALSTKGFVDAGYTYFQIDCGWQGYDLDSNGALTYDSGPFPDGIAPLSDLARSNGMKWSMYTDQGLYACDTSTPLRPGSLGHEEKDAGVFASWNTEYVKVDNCYINGSASEYNAPKDPRTDFPTRFGAMSTALQDNDILGMLVCQWGVPYDSPTGLQGPSQWTPDIATSYRLSDDIASGWSNVVRIANQMVHIARNNRSGPGHFADHDLLEVGNSGMTSAEQSSHFALWAMSKSALMISTDIPNMSDDTLSILQNADLISINQDSLGEPVSLVQRFTNDWDLYSGALANGDVAVLGVDQSGEARTLTINFSTFGIQSADVKDLWTGQTSTGASSSQSAIDAHGSIALRLSNVVSSGDSEPTINYTEAEAGTLAGGASTASCSGCSSGQKVGNIGSGATLTFSNVQASSETMTVRFDYVNCQIGYTFSGGGNNSSGASISINGGAAQDVSFPLTGYNWDTDVLTEYLVDLSGFNVGQDNTIAITKSDDSDWAPDFDRIGVAA